jgi:CrcB protein
MRNFLFLAIGAIAGAGARYGLGVWFSGSGSETSQIPWTTFFINVTGSLLLGFLVRYCAASAISMPVKLMLTTGFCGAYTTMSTFSYEFVTLLERQHFVSAGLYMAGTMIAAPLACLGGFAIAATIL